MLFVFFSFSSKKKRYWTNGEHFGADKTGPIFLIIASDEINDAEWLSRGLWADLAKQFQALTILLESRLSGNSSLANDLKQSNLKHVTLEQSIRDIAAFVSHLNRLQGYEANRWLLFGCSYGATQAAFFNFKYPHLSHAAIASSPVLKFNATVVDYYQRLLKLVLMHDFDCYRETIGALRAVLELLGNSNETRTILGHKLKLCSPIEMRDLSFLVYELLNEIDAIFVKNALVDFAGQQTNETININTYCGTMFNGSPATTLSESLERIARFNDLYLNKNKVNCLSTNYSLLVSYLSREHSSNRYRKSLYLDCYQFGNFQAAASFNYLLPNVLDERYENFLCNQKLSFLLKNVSVCQDSMLNYAATFLVITALKYCSAR